MMRAAFLCSSFLVWGSVSAWSPASSSRGSSVLSRRQALAEAFLTAGAGAVASAVVSPQVARAAAAGGGGERPRVTTRMGGLLEPYSDTARGFRIMAPTGWNRFDGEVGAFDVKWQDLVDPTENVKISSTPVKSTTESVGALGPVEELGIRLAQKRNAELVAASARVTEGVLFYTFDFAIADGTHQLLTLAVAKGKLWSLDANAKEKRWSKRSELYQNIAGSFVPSLNPLA